MMRLAALLLATTSVYAQDYTSLLNGLWEQSDKNADGVLSQAEFLTAAKKLDLKPTIFTSHGKSLETFYAAVDADGSGGLTKKELADSITNFPEYRTPLASAFTNGANKMPNPANLLNVPASVVAAKATVKMSLELAGSISDLYAGTRDALHALAPRLCTGTRLHFHELLKDRYWKARHLERGNVGAVVASEVRPAHMAHASVQCRLLSSVIVAWTAAAAPVRLLLCEHMFGCGCARSPP